MLFYDFDVKCDIFARELFGYILVLGPTDQCSSI